MTVGAYLTATDLMNYAYCPRIIYFVHVLKIPQYTTSKELQGRKKYETFEDEHKRRQLVSDLAGLRREYRLHLSSEKHEIHTFADCVLFDDKERMAYPYQVKHGRKPHVLHRGQRLQICMETLLIEEVYDYHVPNGYIRFLVSDEVVRVDVSKKEEVLKEFGEIRTMLTSEVVPVPSPYRRRCADCCYNSLCWGDVR